MRCILVAIAFTLMVTELRAQAQGTAYEDSLRAILKEIERDSARVKILELLAEIYFFKDPDSCLLYSNEALELSRQLNYSQGILNGLFNSAEALRQTGQLVEALKMQFECLEISQKANDKRNEARSLGFIGLYYSGLHDYEQAILHLKRALAIQNTLARYPALELFTISLGQCYSEIGQPDSAFFFLRRADPGGFKGDLPQLRINKVMRLGNAFFKIEQKDSANIYYQRALKMALEHSDVVPQLLSAITLSLSKGFDETNQPDSSFYFARYSFNTARRKNLRPLILDASIVLSNLHRKNGDLDSAFYYKDISETIKDRIFSEDKFRESQLLLSKEQRRNQELQRAEERRQNRILFIGLVSITSVILVAAVLLFRSNSAKQRTNRALQKTLTELKATQSQLIQSEKMASLGELTAGIAHEIQNPLNFVNNFAEVNKELIADMEDAIQDGKLDEAKNLARNIADNQEKINSHGKRADAIVKSMLQHSRSSSGQKESTDINALCDEYLRLAYHGFRAKNKSLNSIPINIGIDTKLDPSIPKLNVVRQDIGRVLLNLINNAFYAVNEKSSFAKASADNASFAKATAEERYEPSVTVSTKLADGKTEISVRDNGNGIPASHKEKIFQPFFTTKPTGQGTGLGLSLSYDIVKAHGGELIVLSNEGIGSEFIIRL
jgi:two-component system NtrC family sensor kinase